MADDWIWLNGEVLPLRDARINVEDRGFQFADGVYEVVRAYNGKLFALREHLDRFDQSRSALAIDLPIPRQTLAEEMQRLLTKSGHRDAKLYLQLTRGAAPRSHEFVPAKPTLLFYARPLDPMARPGDAPGRKILSVKDERWQRCWIKSIALLPNVLAHNAALAAGADEAVFLDGDIVTECSTSNIFLIQNGKLLTHPVGPKVLPGITRMLLIDIARSLNIPVEERPIPYSEAIKSNEIFLSNTTHECEWVRQWDGTVVGDGKIGPLTFRLHREYVSMVEKMTKG